MKGNVMTRLLFCVTVLLGLGGSVWGQDASLKIKASKEAKTLFVEEKLTLFAEKTGQCRAEHIKNTVLCAGAMYSAVKVLKREKAKLFL